MEKIFFAQEQGYGHADYARSFEEFASVVRLSQSNAWILKRPIPVTAEFDAMGTYPLLCCGDLSKLADDLAGLEDRLVSFSAVLDPFGTFDPTLLREVFPDRLIRFKEHFVTDLTRKPEAFICQHHQRNARKALGKVRVKISHTPTHHLADWMTLYSALIQRHQIRDIRTFSRCAFERQFNVPGVVAFIAYAQTEVTGMLLFFVRGSVAYYHLGAYEETGYATGASFALFREAIEYFRRTNCEWLNLGAGVGASSDDNDGLSRFKRGWATDTRPVYFGGKVLNRDVYDQISKARGNPITDYFPAYRQGEFCKKGKI